MKPFWIEWIFRVASFGDTYFLGAIGARMMVETVLFVLTASFLRASENTAAQEQES